jgi:hypothetical protein
MLMRSWDELRESVVTAGWDFADAALEGDEESDPVDEGFRLQMAQSSEDEDIREMRAEDTMKNRKTMNKIRILLTIQKCKSS